MASGEKKVSAMTFLADVPDNAKIYVVKPGVTTPYFTTKAALLAGISGGTTPTLPQVLAEGDQSISEDGLKKIQIDKASSSVKVYTRPTTGDAWVLKSEYTYNGVSVTDGTDTAAISANGVQVSDSTDSADIQKTQLQITDFTFYATLLKSFLEFTNGTDIASYSLGGITLTDSVNDTSFNLGRIQNNGNDYPLPSGASSPFATLADIPTINENYKGTYTSLTALQTAHPTAALGNYAMVDTGSGNSSKLYIWDAQDGWVLSSNASPSTTDALIEGSTNLYFTVARVLATALTGLSTSDGSDVTSANSILVAIGKLQKQLTDVRAAKEDKRSYMSQSSTRFLDNTTALQRIFNVGSSGNGSIAVTSGRKYRVRGWAVFSGLTSTSKTISFGILGTATASYVSGIAQAVISVALTGGQMRELTSFGSIQIANASATTAAKIYVDFEFNCNGSGTFIPSILFSAAQANMQVDSAYFDIVDIGASTANATSNIV